MVIYLLFGGLSDRFGMQSRCLPWTYAQGARALNEQKNSCDQRFTTV